MIVSDFLAPIENKIINKSALNINTKGYSSDYRGVSFYDCLYNGGGIYSQDLSIIHTLNLYSSVSPFYLAVDKIARAVSEIQMKVKDTNSDEFVDHDVLELLSHPNATMSACEFMYELSTYFSVTGNAFMVSTGRPGVPPLELWSIQPQRITPQYGVVDEVSPAPSRYQMNSTLQNAIFFDEDEIKDGQFSTIRYFNESKGELWHVKQLNPFLNVNNFYGMSKARPLMLELEQYVSGNVNNLSLLKRGARPSTAWVNNRGEELTETQYERILEEAAKYSGDQNAGGTPILDGMDIKEMSQNNRDMQFKELQDNMKADIYNIYGVPLALMSENVMTLNNLETAQIQFYDNAVIPQIDYLTTELTRFLMYRYKNSENLIITYAPSDIEVLRPRTLDNATKLNSLNVNTMNEIRTVLGEQELEEGGDVIMGSSMDRIIAGNMDQSTIDNLNNMNSGLSGQSNSNGEDEDEQDDGSNSQDDSDSQNDEAQDDEEQDDNNSSKDNDEKQFFKRMSKFIDHNGNRRYDDQRIQELWDQVKCL